MLGRRALSRREVAERLARRGFGPDEVSTELKRLEAAGLLDDGALAKQLAEQSARQGYGRRALAATFVRRGLGREAAEEALAGLAPEVGHGALERALERMARRHPDWRHDRAARQRLTRALAQRGFDLDAIRDALGRHAGGD
jgi:regulatory protein